MSKYADIIERLEKVTGPDSDLDLYIANLLDPPVARHSLLHQPVTASLDASVALVKRMLPSALCIVKHGFTPSAMIWFLEQDKDEWPEYRGATYSIALLIALFRAMEAQNDR